MIYSWRYPGSTHRSVMIGVNPPGTLVGAWLGFHAMEGLFALITSIVGATVGANLILLALDIARDRQVPGRYVEPAADEMPEVYATGR